MFLVVESRYAQSLLSKPHTMYELRMVGRAFTENEFRDWVNATWKTGRNASLAELAKSAAWGGWSVFKLVEPAKEETSMYQQKRMEEFQRIIQGQIGDRWNLEMLNDAFAIAEDITNYIGGACNWERRAAFINGMRRQHRTHQQGFTALCIAWLEYLAEAPDNEFDQRNEASRDLAKKILDFTRPEERYLPYI